MAITDYSLKEVVQADACTNCMLCAEVCPAVSATSDGNLSGIYRLHTLNRLFRARAGFLKRFYRGDLNKEFLKAFSDTVYRCTLCGRCEEICPSGISLKDIWISLRQDMVHSDAFPAKVNTIKENVLKSHNVFNEDNSERAEWVSDLDDPPEHGHIKEKADVVYFTGCVSSYFPMAQQIPMSLVSIFNAAGVDFTLLGEDEYCCGFPFLGAGLRDRVDEVIHHNMEAVKKKNATRVVFACPSCYRMWKEYYPPEFELYHVTQYIKKFLMDGRLKSKELNKTVTYHDPCDLGRGSREYDAPREILKSIPGIKFIEMKRNRADCACCGGGGNLEMIDAALSKEIAGAKIKEVLETGADTVVTSCQQCVRTMKSYVRLNKIKLDVLDIVELVSKALKQ
ncbi:MAG: (Fe-S)-binding protein [Desulfatiglans sp.]|jgi:heterodisulfide reductase subunit D|nr:(Fe-S)-binding protein [Desulfatiglans sp.]